MKQRQLITQKTSTAPTTVVSANILQCSTEELYEYIDRLVQENPVVDVDSASRQEQSLLYTRRADWLRKESSPSRSVSDERGENEYTNEMWDMRSESGLTLAQQIMLQLKSIKLNPEQLRIATYIANNLDEDGFVSEDIDETAEHLDVDPVEVCEVLEIMQQQLEPAGVCAFDSRSALCLQVDRLKADELCKKIINEYLEDVAKDKPGSIACSLKQSTRRVAACCELIRSLNPFPCRCIASEDSTCYIYHADIIVTVDNGVIHAELSDSSSPKIILNNYYMDLRARSEDQDVNEYLDGKIQQAQWIQRCIAKRRDMLSSLGSIITKNQADFFLFGAERLAPMAMADVAKELGVHESTVSRAVRSKYLQCSHGLFPLNYFFPSAVHVNRDQIVSSHQIKAQIKKLIDEEDKRFPLNDRIIADILEDIGLNVSRRTVAKYRDALGIDPASKRCCK